MESAQYLAIRYTERLAEVDAVSSVGSKGDSYGPTVALAARSAVATGSIAGDTQRQP